MGRSGQGMMEALQIRLVLEERTVRLGHLLCHPGAIPSSERDFRLSQHGRDLQ